MITKFAQFMTGSSPSGLEQNNDCLKKVESVFTQGVVQFRRNTPYGYHRKPVWQSHADDILSFYIIIT